jgi:phage terminase large subunit-like protein
MCAEELQKYPRIASGHNGHPTLRWHASNAVVRKDSAANIKLDNEKSRHKIDGMAALVNAVGAAIAHPPEPPSVNDQRVMPWLQRVRPFAR